jgi:3-hydroxyisobutyrate dehydrogenase-like beta-hydroxyacid dehydrogenase
MDNDTRIGVIGLGLLGTALAERLLENQHRVVVYNRTRSKAEPLLARGAVWSENPLAECDTVVICLYTTETVQQTLAELAGLRAGQILIDATTGSPTATQALGEQLWERQVDYLECPIAASSEQTRRGQAIAMVAGRREAFERAQPVIAALAPFHTFVGGWGNAARLKLVNNLILGLNRAVLAEGLAFAAAIGLPLNETLEFLKQSNAASEVMQHKGPKMVERDFRTQARLSQHLKDVRLMIEQAESAGLPLRLTPLHAQLLSELEDAGLGDLDNSAIMLSYASDAERKRAAEACDECGEGGSTGTIRG